MSVFFVPGRVELCGNHTDHNNGSVLAASINLGIRADAKKNDSGLITVLSDSFEGIHVDLSRLDYDENDNSATAILKGICFRFRELGHKTGGFDCSLASGIPVGSGLSSSAAYEITMCRILNSFYNNDLLSDLELSRISQFSENVYFKKPSGLMDQLACSAGGLVYIDFSAVTPRVEKLDFNFTESGFKLFVVSTGGSHADLTDKYAEIPREMAVVAKHFEKRTLGELSPDEFWSSLNRLRTKLPYSAILKAAHFFSENERVEKAVSALMNKDVSGFLKQINASGHSSFEYLRNVYLEEEPTLAFALCLADKILDGSGAIRVHGGGFAGTMLSFVPDSKCDEFVIKMSEVLGQNSCRALEIRN